jgi:arsenate reductase
LLLSLPRRAAAEAIGTAFLVAAVVGSGIAAQRLTPADTGMQLLENSIATGGALVALILALGPVSGAHFNPAVTIADRLLGGIATRDAAAYIAAQIGGACAGALAANVMFGLNAVSVSTHNRSSGALWFAEAVATLGLLLVIFGVGRSRTQSTSSTPIAPFAVAGYITAAYWFTSSTSFANPAVTIGRTLSNTFAGIRPASAPPVIVVQLVTACASVALIRFLFPNVDAATVVVPHEAAS